MFLELPFGVSPCTGDLLAVQGEFGILVTLQDRGGFVREGGLQGKQRIEAAVVVLHRLPVGLGRAFKAGAEAFDGAFIIVG